ncbi:NAD(+) synthase [Agrococcus jejuensis]|uniref:Glutamine-dependent NAD(+) synthetase n=1 Tax=Agrococcus jejuensis TaxID=399736 RepID=A0A1G7ZWU3_9MICO|nr:NAD(+) synthase [Agrococcus jejuensis]SDH13165.1 NAD+ synthase (glutamine-hydrolysing) [Agrococcus jejuensis]
MDAFRSAYAHGFARVAACTLPVALAQPAVNAERIAERVRALDAEGVAVAVFPELSLSGYALDDLHLQDVLLDAVDRAVVDLAEATADCAPIVAVGAPLAIGSRVFNCAVLLHRGVVLGVVPKMSLPNYREFYELRWFAEGSRAPAVIQRPHWPGADEDGELPCGPDLVVVADDVPGLAVHAEICEDMWVPVPPSSLAALAGATVLLNLSASPITVGRAEDRHLLARSASARANAVYAYAAASEGESSTDLSWDGMTMVYEMGDLLGESERFPSGPAQTIVDVDLDRLRQERMRQGSFDQNGAMIGVPGVREIHVELEPTTADIGLLRTVDRFPFVPDDPARLALDCYEAYNIQVSGLEQRLRALTTDTYAPTIVIGVSGGLDSTHALIVAAKALERLGRPVTDILAFTMPGFATSDGTKSNAIALMEALGVTWDELDIRPVATSMLQAIGHPAGDGEPVYDVTFENVQAGLRTDLLFRIANQRGGIVLGTGDLSELALGWCTYGVGDHMSHYGVNGGIPKTLIQHLIRWVVDTGQFGADVDRVLTAIVGQEISPELVPQTEEGALQSTESMIGPYPLQDFTLFHVLRRGYRPSKIAFLAMHAWGDASAGAWPVGYPDDKRVAYDLATIRRWLEVFVRRFFQHQFKRSALPNGPKVVAGGSLSPRGDWRMPSDASAAAWLAELDAALPAAADGPAPR